MSNGGDDERRVSESPPPPPQHRVLREILRVEQQRIERDNRRTAVAEKALDVGSEPQRAAATALVTPALIGIAGYGVITTLVNAVKGLTKR